MRSGSEVTSPAVEQPATEPAIEVRDLAVTYRVRSERPTLRSLLKSLRPRSGGSTQRIQALRGVSLDVPRGEILGVIGRNGAGKSTLLRALAGVVPPSRGRIVVRGDVTPLFSLGVGFHRKLTGRDNVRLGALATGLEGTRFEQKLEDIIRFADLGEFIDYPMSSYSKGMRGRLGFSVAAHLEPDILLIDEALGAGDASFKDQSRTRLNEMCGEGRTVVIVTHGMGTILEMTTECLWLHEGRVRQQGPPRETVDAYMRFLRLGASGLLDTDDEPEDDFRSDDVGMDDDL